jgi:hypothetical protein
MTDIKDYTDRDYNDNLALVIKWEIDQYLKQENLHPLVGITACLMTVKMIGLTQDSIPAIFAFTRAFTNNLDILEGAFSDIRPRKPRTLSKREINAAGTLARSLETMLQNKCKAEGKAPQVAIIPLILASHVNAGTIGHLKIFYNHLAGIIDHWDGQGVPRH